MTLLLMRPFKLHFHVVLFIMLPEVALTFKSVDETLECNCLLKAIEYFLHVVLFIMPQRVILTFMSVHELSVLLDTLDKIVLSSL